MLFIAWILAVCSAVLVADATPLIAGKECFIRPIHQAQPRQGYARLVQPQQHTPLSAMRVCRRNAGALATLRAKPSDDLDEAPLAPAFSLSPGLLVKLFVCSALLGPFLDGYHGAFDVLEYRDPLIISLGGVRLLGTAAWVPGLFGVAGIIIGGLYCILDQVLATPPSRRSPSWPQVLAGISLFSFQYYLSGLLAAQDWEPNSLTATLLALAAVQFAVFDRSKAGLIVGALTAVGGPLIEVAIINGLHAYYYTNPDWVDLGIPSWIWAVYLAGAPAVGNLSRRFVDIK